MNEESKKLIIMSQSGYTAELDVLMETAKLLVRLGYDVRRVKVQRPGQKTLLNAIEAREQETPETVVMNA